MPKTALVVDDSQMVREVVASILRQDGFVVEEASDGWRALTRLEQGSPPDVMVCDVSMPKINGIELLEELQDRGLQPPAVLFLSIEGHPAMVRRARALGAGGWLLKPVRAEVLLSAVRKVMTAAA